VERRPTLWCGFAKSAVISHLSGPFLFSIIYPLLCPLTPACPSSFLFLPSPCVPHILILALVSPPREYARHSLSLFCSRISCTHARSTSFSSSSSDRRPSPFSGPRVSPSLSLSLSPYCYPSSLLSFFHCMPVLSPSLCHPVPSLRLLTARPSPPSSHPRHATRPRGTWLCGCTWRVATRGTHSGRPTDRHGTERLRMRSTYGAEGTDDSGRVHTARRSALSRDRSPCR